MLVSAFVLIKVGEKDLFAISDKLLSYDGITEVHVVAGEYDIVAVVRVPDNTSLSKLLTEQVVHTPGILSTKTLISLQSQATFDLDEVFSGRS